MVLATHLVLHICNPSVLCVLPFLQGVHKPSDLCDLLFALRPGSLLQPGGLYDSLVAAAGLPASATAMPPGGTTATASVTPGVTSATGTTTTNASTAAAGSGKAAADASAGNNPINSSSSSSSESSSSKVNLVCQAVREAVHQLPGAAGGGYLKVVVIAYMRSDPPDLEAALVAVREAKEAGVNGCSSSAEGAAAAAAAGHTLASSSSSSSIGSEDGLVAAAVAGEGAGGGGREGRVANGTASAAAGGTAVIAEHLSSSADAALKHLLLYIDPDELYKVALGLYDLPLAFMVINQAQKDPGEYLQELSGFGGVADPNLQRYQIDMHLGRFSKALGHLHAAGPWHFEGCLKLAKERGLLRQLLQLQQKEVQGEEEERKRGGGLEAAAEDQQQQQQGADGDGVGVLSAKERVERVLEVYGAYLMDQRRAEDAAVAYAAAGRLEHALKAYK